MANPDLPNFKLPIITAPADTFQRDVRNALQALASALGGGVSDGEDGADGAPGPQGDPGTNGLDGDDGATGPAGPAPSGTGFVHVTAGALDTPAELTGDVTAGASGVTAIGANKVLDTMMRQAAGLSVIGRTANSTGNVADIVAGTDGHVLKRSGATLVFAAEQDLTGIGLGVFGNGRDGSAVFDGVATVLGFVPFNSLVLGVTIPGYTMTRNLYLTNCTVDSGVFLFTNNFGLYVNGTLTNNGIIGTWGAAGGTGTVSTFGTGGGQRAANVYGAGSNGGDGGNTSTGVSVAGGALAAAPYGYSNSGGLGIAGSNGSDGLVGKGGGGGATNDGAGNTKGSDGGTITVSSPSQGDLPTLAQMMTGCHSASATRFTCGTGGGGGRGDPNGALGGGGGGGGGGAATVVFARLILGSGSFNSHGGLGGNGFNRAGGGGGGGGGWAGITIGTGSFPTTNVTGGNGGTSLGEGSVFGWSGGSGGPGQTYLLRIGA